MERISVGIDVAKDRLDVHVRPSGEAFAVARDGKGLEELAGRLGGLDASLVVLEATGGYEVTVAAALCAAGLPLAVVNPRQIRDFARSTGQLAKTDALDAAAIAHFAEAVDPAPRPVPDEQARALGEPVARRRQIVDMMTAERNRRSRLASPPVPQERRAPAQGAPARTERPRRRDRPPGTTRSCASRPPRRTRQAQEARAHRRSKLLTILNARDRHGKTLDQQDRLHSLRSVGMTDRAGVGASLGVMKCHASAISGTRPCSSRF